MNPIAAIEKLINEHGSAAVLKERLELASDQFAALERKLADSEERVTRAEGRASEAEERVTRLEDENKRLEAKLQEFSAEDDGLPSEREEILKLLHEHETLSVEQIAGAISLSAPDVKHYMDQLLEGEFIALNLNKTMNANRQIISSGLLSSRRGSSRPSPKTLGFYYIKAKGREYVVTKRI